MAVMIGPRAPKPRPNSSAKTTSQPTPGTASRASSAAAPPAVHPNDSVAASGPPSRSASTPKPARPTVDMSPIEPYAVAASIGGYPGSTANATRGKGTGDNPSGVQKYTRAKNHNPPG